MVTTQPTKHAKYAKDERSAKGKTNESIATEGFYVFAIISTITGKGKTLKRFSSFFRAFCVFRRQKNKLSSCK